jgi:hypothetical protein
MSISGISVEDNKLLHRKNSMLPFNTSFKELEDATLLIRSIKQSSPA